MDLNSEVSDPEVIECCENAYDLLTNGHYKEVKVRKDMFTCPFCSGKKKQFYKYTELLQHANGVGNGSVLRKAEQKGNHLALEKYLKIDLAAEADSRVPISSSSNQSEDLYVWPWVGIIIKPVRSHDNKNMLLDSDYWWKKNAKFHPLEVKTLWIEKDSAIVVVLRFNSSWSGFENVSELEKEYAIKHCGKHDWIEKRGSDWRSKTYAWCAGEDDYNTQGLIAEHLSSFGELRSFSDIAKLAREISVDNVQSKKNEKLISLKKVLRQNEELDRAYNEDTRRIHEISRVNIRKTLAKHESLSRDLKLKLKNLKDSSEEFNKKEALTELERQKLDEDKKKLDAQNRSLQLASKEQKRTDDELLRTIEKHKRKKEESLNKIYQLEKELESKQRLRMEIQELKGKMQVMEHAVDEDDEEFMNKMKEMTAEFEDKCSELQDLEDTNFALRMKEHDDIQEVREELIMGLRGLLSDGTDIKIERIGELDDKPFMKACKERFGGEEAEVQYAILYSKWQENLKDHAWYSFKRVGTGDNMKEVVDEEDEQLRNLREEWGEEVKDAVKTALEELNNFNPSGHYSGSVLWNSKQGRRATLKEVIDYMKVEIKLLSSLKRKRSLQT